jgi:hypothetical protein
METEDLQARKETRDECSKVSWEALMRAQKAYEEAKKQAKKDYREARYISEVQPIGSNDTHPDV